MLSIYPYTHSCITLITQLYESVVCFDILNVADNLFTF